MGNESTRFFFVIRLPDEKSHFCGVPRFNLHYHLHGGTRVKAGANVAAQSFMLHRCRIAQRAVTPDEPRAISGKRSRRWSRSGKSDAIAKFGVVRIPSEEALAL